MSNEFLEVSPSVKPLLLHMGNTSISLNKPLVMGILNITPDSFADGGRYQQIDHALHRVEQMLQEGADIIDIGAESSRPTSQKISSQQELERLMPVLLKIKTNFDVPISVDTYKPEVMREAITAGVTMINDITALGHETAVEIIANSNVAVCLMHMQGSPDTMQQNPHYQNVVQEVFSFLQQRVQLCLNAGINANRIIIDPGFGFGKTTVQNLQLLKNLRHFSNLGYPVLAGLSRKASIGEILNAPVDERLYGSIAAHVTAVIQGANIIRTHDIKPTCEAIKIANAVSMQEILACQ